MFTTPKRQIILLESVRSVRITYLGLEKNKKNKKNTYWCETEHMVGHSITSVTAGSQAVIRDTNCLT